METENRRTASAFAAVTAAAALFAGCAYLYHLNNKKIETEHRIQILEEEKAELQEKLDNTEQSATAAETEIAELSRSEEKLGEQRNEYYRTCKELEDAVVNGTSDYKIAYLTFDDGPYVKTTGRYLDVLEEYDVLATFFQIGKPSEDYDALYRRVYEAGHTVANHTYSHQIRNGIYLSTDAFMNDVRRNREFIQDKLGITTNILRFPGGSSTARGLKPAIIEQLRHEGYGWVDWNSATGDGMEIMTPAEYRDNVLKKTGGRKLLVVLMHDYSANTLTALPEIITGLRNQGYILLPLFYESSMINK